jgi:hypothetical protein
MNNSETDISGQNPTLARLSSTFRRRFLISGTTLNGQIKIAKKAIMASKKTSKTGRSALHSGRGR